MSKDLQVLLATLFPELWSDPALQQGMLQHAAIHQLPAGQTVCQQDQDCGYLPLLLTGRVRVFKLAESGREITLYRIEAGESCILTASCIMSSIPFPALAITETQVDTLLIPSKLVHEWLGKSMHWRTYLFGLLARRFADVISVVEEVAFRRMDARVASWLLENEASGKVHTTHQDMAIDLGSSREVISRILRDLENNQLVRRQRGEIRILQHSALRQLAE